MKPVSFSRTSVRRMCIAAVLLFVAVQGAHAQPTLVLKRVINNWPTIELYFSVGCNGIPMYDMTRDNFDVYENGRLVQDFTLWCPDPNARCSLSAGLVFDCGAGMAGEPLATAIAAGQRFVSYFDGTQDEACVVRADSGITTMLGFTKSKTALRDTIAALTAGSAPSAFLDGCYTALEQIKGGCSNPCRAIIVFTDGHDIASAHTETDVINLATRNRIRVFTIGLGTVEPGMLTMIASSTGGRYYYCPTPAQIHQIFEDVTAIIRQSFQECIITYEARCMDGAKRTVDLVLKDYCGGGRDQKQRIYTAPRDTSTFMHVVFNLGKGTAISGNTVTIPLTLNTSLDSAYFPKSTFYIQIDNPICGVRFKNIASPPGTLLEGVPITTIPEADRITFQTTERKLLQGEGVLAYMTFTTGDPLDTCCSAVRLTSWHFEDGCFRPMLSDGEACVIPVKPDVACSMTGPTTLQWDGNANDYTPNPITVKMMLTNTGDKVATNTRFRIAYDAADFSLAGPMIDVVQGSPVNVPANYGTSEAKWDLRAKPRLTGDTAIICITAMFNNHHDIDGCWKVYIPPSSVVAVESRASAFSLDVYPEPNTGLASVALRVDRPQAVEMTLCDLLGRAVASPVSTRVDGTVTLPLDMRALAPGMYYLHVRTAEKSYIKIVTRR